MKPTPLFVALMIISLTACGTTKPQAKVGLASTTPSITKNVSPTSTSTTTIASTSTTGALKVIPSVATSTFTRSGSSPNYSVTVNYPVLGGMLSNAVQGGINAQIISAISNWTNSFVQNLSLQPGVGQGALRSSLTGTFKAQLVDYKVASFQFLIVEVGASSPTQSTLVETLNFNLGTGSLYNLSDLFKPNSNYLNLLSSESIQFLATQLASSNVSLAQLQNNTQLSPLPANFSAFSITTNAIVIGFSQGQIDQGSLGALSVTIPLSTLTSVISPSGPLVNP